MRLNKYYLAAFSGAFLGTLAVVALGIVIYSYL